jgi:hypothetical protein
MSSGSSSGGPHRPEVHRPAIIVLFYCSVTHCVTSREIMSQEEVIAPRASALQLEACCGILAGLGRGEERALHRWCRRSLWFANNGRSCCSTVGSLSRPTLFVKKTVHSFVRPSVHPSVYTQNSRFCNFPRSCSIYKPCFSTTHCQCALLSFTKRCLLPSLAGPLNQVVHARPAAHGPPATAKATGPTATADVGCVRRSQVIGAW